MKQFSGSVFLGKCCYIHQVRSDHSKNSSEIKSQEVVSQLLSMQGRSVGTIQDKLVASSISQERVATHLCSLYSGPDLQQRSQFLIQLAVNYEIDQENIKKVALELAESEGSGKPVENTHKKMKESLTPPQNLVFTKIGQIQGGVKFLVDLRKNVIEAGNQVEAGNKVEIKLNQTKLNWAVTQLKLKLV